MDIAIFWFRRDLRLEDNKALYHALNCGLPVLCVFIFDTEIIEELPAYDARVTFIYNRLEDINNVLEKHGSNLKVMKGKPMACWQQLQNEYQIKQVFINKDYEPYARHRDKELKHQLLQKNTTLHTFKDHVIFEESEIVKDNDTPYLVFTPFMKKWKSKLSNNDLQSYHSENGTNYLQVQLPFPSLQEIGFTPSEIKVPEFRPSNILNYEDTRNLPIYDTSFVGVHLRFGTLSIRSIVSSISTSDTVYLNELIWREFFMQILFHFPASVNNNFKKKYDGIKWRNNHQEFKLWSQGKTGYPIVDAGMRQLNETGFMHNRVRMIVASFLCKHLLIDWRWGEAYFAKKLLDYELSSNNGNWQWVAGTGCDAAPYFRIFNPEEQTKKFDKNLQYIKRWVTDLNTSTYPAPIVDHKYARIRALETYKAGIAKYAPQ